MKKILSLIGTMLLVVLFAGCSVGSDSNNSSATDGENPEASEDADKETYRVAFIARAQDDSFAAWMVNEFKAEAEKYDDISLDVFDAESDDTKGNNLIENAIVNNYDGIIFQPNNGEVSRPYIEQIVEAGIPVVSTNPRVDGIEGLSNIDADPYEQGAVNARAAVDQIPKNARVVVLNGPAGNAHTTARRKAWEEEFFAQRSDVDIIAEDIANWNKDEAMQLTEDWITAHGEFDAIISMNDNMAAGALEAVKDDSRYEDILVYGVDGTAEAVLLIQEGLMTTTSLQSAIDLAKLNIEAIHKLMTGEEQLIDEELPAPLINADNVDEYVEMYKEVGLIK